jgi:hypothetical protein
LTILPTRDADGGVPGLVIVLAIDLRDQHRIILAGPSAQIVVGGWVEIEGP